MADKQYARVLREARESFFKKIGIEDVVIKLRKRLRIRDD